MKNRLIILFISLVLFTSLHAKTLSQRFVLVFFEEQMKTDPVKIEKIKNKFFLRAASQNAQLRFFFFELSSDAPCGQHQFISYPVQLDGMTIINDVEIWYISE